MKKSSAVFALLIACFPLSSRAQSAPDTTGWKRSGNGLFNLSQAYFDNWTTGGTDALNWEIHLDGDAALNRPDYIWESKGHAFYGQSKLADQASRKSSDELYLESVYTRKLNAWVNPFASANVRSQFMPGYTYNDAAGTRTRVSGSFDPTYAIQTVGAGYGWRKELSVRLGGSTKETFSSRRFGYADDKTTTPVDTQAFKLEPGASLTVNWQKSLMENIQLATLLDVFENFKGIDQTVVRWENNVTAKVNKYVNTSFGFDMLYDRNLSTRRQIKENLAVGISFLTL